MDTVAEPLEPWIVVREPLDGATLADALFRRRYRQPAPDFPHQVLAFWCDGADEIPVCYIHFTALGSALLGGGACVDERVLRRMPAPARAAIRDAGGMYKYTLAWSVRHFGARFGAIFGYCGDALAERIDLAVGFAQTQHPHLLVYWTRETDASERQNLIAQAHAVGPF
jgi:hypothetical protein